MNAVLQAKQLPVWQGGILRCTQRIDETHDSTTFVLSTDHPAIFDYLPGQFISIGVEIDGKKHYRAYSISSMPQQAETLAITVKRVACGLVSNYLIDHFKVGDQLDALAPVGEFHLPEKISGKQIMLSAGSGITPMMSMARWLIAHHPDIDIHFIHCARTERDIIFRDELIAMTMRHAQFTLDLFLSQPEGGIWCHHGRLTPERLTALLPDVVAEAVNKVADGAANSDIYLCGNEDFMKMVEGWHAAQSLPTNRFFKESFAPIALPEVDPNGAVFALSVPAFDKTTQIAEGQSLLDALEAESLPILGACRSGVCGSCKCKVIAGEVEQLSTETLTPEEIDSGVVLACSTQAKSALTVEIVI